MEEIKPKKESLAKVMATLQLGIDQYHKAQAITDCTDTCCTIFRDRDELIRTTRDSMIQRFEYCVDSLWKYLKIYLETVEKVTLDTKSPRGIYKALCATRKISEDETELALEMCDARYITSHIYKEEQAELLTTKIARFYALMETIINRVDGQ